MNKSRGRINDLKNTLLFGICRTLLRQKPISSGTSTNVQTSTSSIAFQRERCLRLSLEIFSPRAWPPFFLLSLAGGRNSPSSSHRPSHSLVGPLQAGTFSSSGTSLLVGSFCYVETHGGWISLDCTDGHTPSYQFLWSPISSSLMVQFSYGRCVACHALLSACISCTRPSNVVWPFSVFHWHFRTRSQREAGIRCSHHPLQRASPP